MHCDTPTLGSITPETPIDELPVYLSVDEVRRYLRVGRTSAYEFARDRGVRVGKLLRVPREVLHDLATPGPRSGGGGRRDSR